MKTTLTRQEKEILVRLLKQLVEEGGEGQREPIDLNAVLREFQNIGNRVSVRVTDVQINMSGGYPVLQITYDHNLFDLMEDLVDRIGEETWNRLGTENPDVLEGILRGLFLRVLSGVIRDFNASWIDDLIDRKVDEFMAEAFRR